MKRFVTLAPILVAALLSACFPKIKCGPEERPCSSHYNCEEWEYCGEGICQPDICDPGEAICGAAPFERVFVCDQYGGEYVLSHECEYWEFCADGECRTIQHQLTIRKTGQGLVASKPVGIECGKGCSEQIAAFDIDTEVTLEASPKCGWSFVGWEGDCDASGVAVMTGDLDCRANFEQNADPGVSLLAGDTQVRLDPDPTWGMVISRVERIGDQASAWPVKPGPLWSLELWRENEPIATERLGPDQAEGFECWVRDPDTQVLGLVWTGIEAAVRDTYDLTVTVRPRPDDDLVGFSARMTYHTGPGQAGIGRLDLPLIDFQDLGPQTELYLAVCGGVRFEDPAASARAPSGDPPVEGPLDLKYPALQNMRFDALADPDQGLVVVLGIDDPPEARWAIKQFTAGGTDAGDVRLAVGQLPDDPFTPRDLDLPGEAVLGAVPCPNPQACWHAAAGWYRERIEAEGYLERGPMAQESPAVQAALGFGFLNLVGADLAAGTPPDFAEFVTWLDDITAWLGVTPEQTISIWYDWHANPFDEDLPEHMPPEDGFADAVAAATASGYRILPYTNTTLWGTHLASYAELDVAARAGVVQRDGTPQILDLHDQADHALDFGVAWVGEHFSDYLFEPLLADFSVSGFYLDFFPSGQRCFASDHGHPQGGGASYVQGVRDYFRMIADLSVQHSGEPLVMSENMGDTIADLSIAASCYRDIDFWGVGDARMSHVPLFDAVFHDRIQMATIGVTDFPGIDTYVIARDQFEQAGNEFFLNVIRDTTLLGMGWAFAAGHHLVLLRRPIFDAARGIESLRDDPYLSGLMDFYKDAMTLRNHPALSPFLVFGRMAPPPLVQQVDTLDDPAVTQAVLPAARTAVPKVFSYAFQDAEGDLAVTLINWDSQPASVQLVIDPNLYGMANDGAQLLDTWRVTAYSPGGAIVLTEDLNQNPEWLVPTFDASFPSREPWVLVFEKI